MKREIERVSLPVYRYVLSFSVICSFNGEEFRGFRDPPFIPFNERNQFVGTRDYAASPGASERLISELQKRINAANGI